MQKIAVFYNKFASRSSERWIDEVKAILFRSELFFYEIPRPYRLKKIIEQLIQEQFDLVVCIGGDGSMNLLIQELAYKKLKFLLIPAGTANDLARELGLVKRIPEAILAIRKSCAKKIDLIDVNGKLFATNGGMGIGAEVTGVINSVRSRFPRTNLLLKIFKHKIYTLVLSYFSLHPKLHYYQLQVESKEYSGIVETPFVFILNQAKVAGDIQLVPDSKNNDGLFHVVIFTHQNRVKLLKCFVHILLGTIPKDDHHYISFCTTEVKFISNRGEKVEFFGDGEILGKSKSIHVKILPEALEVFVTQEEQS